MVLEEEPSVLPSHPVTPLPMGQRRQERELELCHWNVLPTPARLCSWKWLMASLITMTKPRINISALKISGGRGTLHGRERKRKTRFWKRQEGGKIKVLYTKEQRMPERVNVQVNIRLKTQCGFTEHVDPGV